MPSLVTETALADVVAQYAADAALADVCDRVLGIGSPEGWLALASRTGTSDAVALRATQLLLSGVPEHQRWLPTRLAANPSVRPAVQQLLVEANGELALGVAAHTTEPRVVADLVRVASRRPSMTVLRDADNQVLTGAGCLLGVLVVLERAHDKPALAAALLAAGVDDLCRAVITTPGHPLAEEYLRWWGLLSPDLADETVLGLDDRALVCQRATYAAACDGVRDRVLDWVCVDLSTATSSDDFEVLATLYHCVKFLNAAHRDRLRDAIRSCPDLGVTRRKDWLQNLATTEVERDQAEDPAVWAAMPLTEARKALELLNHKLPTAAASAFVARRDVPSDLAFTVARTCSHLSQAWMELRAWDEVFVVRSLATMPGWVDVAEHAHLAVQILEYAVAHKVPQPAIESLSQKLAPVLTPDDHRAMTWATLDVHRRKDDRAAKTLASMLAPVLKDPISTTTLTTVLGTEAAATLTVADVFAVVHGSNR